MGLKGAVTVAKQNTDKPSSATYKRGYMSVLDAVLVSNCNVDVAVTIEVAQDEGDWVWSGGVVR